MAARLGTRGQWQHHFGNPPITLDLVRSVTHTSGLTQPKEIDSHVLYLEFS